MQTAVMRANRGSNQEGQQTTAGLGATPVRGSICRSRRYPYTEESDDRQRVSRLHPDRIARTISTSPEAEFPHPRSARESNCGNASPPAQTESVAAFETNLPSARRWQTTE